MQWNFQRKFQVLYNLPHIKVCISFYAYRTLKLLTIGGAAVCCKEGSHTRLTRLESSVLTITHFLAEWWSSVELYRPCVRFDCAENCGKYRRRVGLYNTMSSGEENTNGNTWETCQLSRWSRKALSSITSHVTWTFFDLFKEEQRVSIARGGLGHCPRISRIHWKWENKQRVAS